MPWAWAAASSRRTKRQRCPGIVECPYVVTKHEAERVVLDEVNRGLVGDDRQPGHMLRPVGLEAVVGQDAAGGGPLRAVCSDRRGSFCDVRDVAAGAIAAATRGASGRRYILGGHNLSYRASWQEMARVTAAARTADADGADLPGLCLSDSRRPQPAAAPEGEANSAILAMSLQDHCFKSDRAQQELGYQIRPLHRRPGGYVALVLRARLCLRARGRSLHLNCRLRCWAEGLIICHDFS